MKEVICMPLTKENYKKRIIDDKIKIYLKLFGAISIEGPKWCGKTWTALNFSETAYYLFEDSIVNLAKDNPETVLSGKYPILIDEWQIVPTLWDKVRYECDKDKTQGKFFLTGSTTLEEESKEKVHHSGAGRIATIQMYPMSLYESGDSTGEISLMDMYNQKKFNKIIKQKTPEELAYYTVRGGWPENVDAKKDCVQILPKEYINALLKKDMHQRLDKKRDSRKMEMIIKSLARNESTVVSFETILKDVGEYSDKYEKIDDRRTVIDYIGVLDDLYFTTYQEAYKVNYRSSDRIGKSSKRHLVDPSLSCAALGLTIDKLVNDFKTFGYMFEALVERDLRIYIENLNGHLYHFRDNLSGDEVDAIVEFEDGEYAAIEIKLSNTKIDEAKESLLKFYENAGKKPKFMCAIIGTCNCIIKDEKTGIYIIPPTALK